MLWLSLFCCKQCSADRAENCRIVAVSHLTAVWFSCRKVKSHVMTAAMDIEPFMPGEVFLCQMSEKSGKNEKNNRRFPSFSSRFAFLINWNFWCCARAPTPKPGKWKDSANRSNLRSCPLVSLVSKLHTAFGPASQHALAQVGMGNVPITTCNKVPAIWGWTLLNREVLQTSPFVVGAGLRVRPSATCFANAIAETVSVSTLLGKRYVSKYVRLYQNVILILDLLQCFILLWFVLRIPPLTKWEVL